MKKVFKTAYQKNTHMYRFSLKILVQKNQHNNNDKRQLFTYNYRPTKLFKDSVNISDQVVMVDELL